MALRFADADALELAPFGFSFFRKQDCLCYFFTSSFFRICAGIPLFREA
jgi:hypothetical protein